MAEAERVSERAPAKINPYLRVVGRRADGYHDVETVVLPLDLADRVTVVPRAEAGFGLTVTGPRADGVPAGEDNLVIRAARALAAATGSSRGANVLLEKNVPVAAGLGGGSSDAAATLRALDRAWGTALGEAALSEIGAMVGSDVPALVTRRPVLARGRGEIVSRIEAPPTWWVLVTFDAGIRAEDAYRWWDRSLRRRLERPPPLEDALRAVAGGDPSRIAATMHNSLEAGILRRHPSVAAAGEALLRGGPPSRTPLGAGGAAGAIVSGSGPTVAGLCRGRDHALGLAQMVGAIATRACG